MHYAVIFVFLMVFVLGLGWAAKRLNVPYPILFVIGGFLISFMPHLPVLRLDPDFVFFIFLPPLLYIQAFYTSWRDFRRELRPILMLAIGLVFATTITVAYVAHWLIPNYPLSAGFVLGAIISPPDAIAASAIAERLGLPRRITTILEGESLVNDSTSLVLFQVALASISMHGEPVIGTAWVPGEFLGVSIGGIAVGLAVGWLINELRKRIVNEGSQFMLSLSLLTPFLSYLAGDMCHVSSVLAVVAAGMYIGWKSPTFVTAATRLQAQAVWDMIVYLLNGFVFILIGLQLPGILTGMREHWWPNPFFYAVVINVVCILVRLAWVFPGAYLPYWLSRYTHEPMPRPDPREVFIIGWCGMRGVVSLAAALALNGMVDFPRSHLTQFIAFSVILITLVFQGLTLPGIIRRFGVGDDGCAAEEEHLARTTMLTVAFEKLSRVRSDGTFTEKAAGRVEEVFRDHALLLEDNVAEQLGWSEHRHHYLSVRRLHKMLLATQRRALVGLRQTGRIGDDVMHKIEHELDIDETRLKL